METRQQQRERQSAGAPASLLPGELCWKLAGGAVTMWIGTSAGVKQITGAGASVAWNDITGVPAYATRWPSWTEVTGKPNLFAPSADIPTGANLNTYKTPGIYRQPAMFPSVTNWPVDGAGAVLVYATDGADVSQTVLDYGSGNIYVRGSSPSWSSWQRVYTTADPIGLRDAANTWTAKQTFSLDIGLPGTTAQYVRGDGSRATFPTTWAWGNISGRPVDSVGIWPSIDNAIALPLCASDLNTHVTGGMWVQTTNNAAQNGANYPVPRAGLLTVTKLAVDSGGSAGLIQRYEEYMGGPVFIRGKSGGGAWTAWKQVAYATDTVPWAQLTGIPVYATRWPAWSEVSSKPAAFPPSAHSHAWGDLTGVPVYATRWPSRTEVTGMGTAAAYNIGASGGAVPLLIGANIWSAQQAFAVAPLSSGQPNAGVTTQQGMYTGWNLSGGGGEANIVNHRGLGSGGVTMWDRNVAGAYMPLLSVGPPGAHINNINPPQGVLRVGSLKVGEGFEVKKIVLTSTTPASSSANDGTIYFVY